ncbi:minor capsid protein [Cystobacter fuscus]
MALRDVELDIALVLEAAGLGLSMADVEPTLYAGPIPEAAPDRLVAVRGLSGGEPEDYLGNVTAIYRPEVQVIIRGNRNGYRDTLALASACFELLRNIRPSGYIRIDVESSQPEYMGADDLDRHRFIFTVNTEYRATNSISI